MPQKMFLKLKGIKGESKNPRHHGEIEISSFTWGIKPQGGIGAGGGGGAGKATVNDLIFSKNSDKTSPVLRVACHTGQPFAEGVLTLEEVSASGGLSRSGVIKLESVLIDFMTSDNEMDTVGLSFGKLTIERS